MKAIRELGLDRRETGRSISAKRKKKVKALLQYERTGLRVSLVRRLFIKKHCRVATY